MFTEIALLLRIVAACYPLAFGWAAWAHFRALEAYAQLAHAPTSIVAGPVVHMLIASTVACVAFLIAYSENLLDGDVSRLEHAANCLCIGLHGLVLAGLAFISLPLLIPLSHEPVMWWSVVGFGLACPMWLLALAESA